MKKCIYLFIFLILPYSIVYADNKKDLFDDYGIYSKEIDKRIAAVKKEVYKEIDKIKSLLIDNKIDTVNEKLNIIHSKIQQLDNYIKESCKTLKTDNMKYALTYPVYELSFYEKVIKETVNYYNKKGSITKKEIKEIEKKYKDEEADVKKQAETIRKDFLKAVFN
ncbi:MAG: hypothetical protein K2N11_08385 [Mucispirillum sp.]|nr:hypothetical protein [Mucispirillum sp.]